MLVVVIVVVVVLVACLVAIVDLVVDLVVVVVLVSKPTRTGERRKNFLICIFILHKSCIFLHSDEMFFMYTPVVVLQRIIYCTLSGYLLK